MKLKILAALILAGYSLGFMDCPSFAASDPEPQTLHPDYIYPAKGVLTAGFGWRWGRMHSGIDIAAAPGTPILAAARGMVTFAGWSASGYGNLVKLTHPDGSVTLYAHNAKLLVQAGESVSQGQLIAEMGSTGYSTGPHCHFEIHRLGQGAVDPIAYLPGDTRQAAR